MCTHPSARPAFSATVASSTVAAASHIGSHGFMPTLGLELRTELRLPNKHLRQFGDVHREWCATDSDHGGQLRRGELWHMRLRLSLREWS